MIKTQRPPRAEEQAHVRVELIRRSDEVTVVKLSTFNARHLVDYGLKDYYDSFDKLPQWIQDKLIKLHLLPKPPPRQDIPNLGTKIADTVYWIVGLQDENDDTNS